MSIVTNDLVIIKVERKRKIPRIVRNNVTLRFCPVRENALPLFCSLQIPISDNTVA